MNGVVPLVWDTWNPTKEYLKGGITLVPIAYKLGTLLSVDNISTEGCRLIKRLIEDKEFKEMVFKEYLDIAILNSFRNASRIFEDFIGEYLA